MQGIFSYKKSIIWALLCGCPMEFRLSVHPSVHPSFCLSVHPRSLVQSISSFPLAQSGPDFTYRVLWGKGYAVTLNHVSKLNLKVIAELYVYEKPLSWAYLLSPLFNLAQTSLTECLWSMRVQWSWMKFVGQRSRSYWLTQIIFSEHIYFLVSSIWVILHTKHSFWVKGVQWPWTKFLSLRLRS